MYILPWVPHPNPTPTHAAEMVKETLDGAVGGLNSEFMSHCLLCSPPVYFLEEPGLLSLLLITGPQQRIQKGAPLVAQTGSGASQDSH